MSTIEASDGVEYLCNNCVGVRRAQGRRFHQIEPLIRRDDDGDPIISRDTGRTTHIEGVCGSCGNTVIPINQTELRHKDGDSRNRDTRAAGDQASDDRTRAEAAADTARAAAAEAAASAASAAEASNKGGRFGK